LLQLLRGEKKKTIKLKDKVTELEKEGIAFQKKFAKTFSKTKKNKNPEAYQRFQRGERGHFSTGQNKNYEQLQGAR
jgi:hypothetical protein